jgi:uncharacterized protein
MEKQFKSNNFGISDKSYQFLVNYFKGIPEIESVFIFGSRVKNNYRNGSDIDLAIFGTNLTEKNIWDTTSYINEVLPIPYKVDIVHFETVKSEELKENIKNTSKKFY